MKKIYYILFACLLTSIFYGQQVNNTEFKTKTNQVFQNLDKNRIPHGILLDFGMEFTNVRAFNGTLTDSTYTNAQTLSDIYKTLLMCRARQVNTGFVSPQEYTTRWYTQRTKGVITLSGQYFKYNRFADNAYPSRLNYSNEKFSDKFVGSVWQDPYEERQLFAMSPSVSTYQSLNFSVKFPANLFFSNYPETVQNIQIDFSDGSGYRVLTYDQAISVYYSQAGTYTWTYKITLTNGQILLSHSKINVEDGVNPRSVSGRPTSAKTAVDLSIYSKTTITAATPYLGTYGSATVYFKYANGSYITKPLIVAEGFDTGVILTPEKEGGDTNIATFLDDTLYGGYLNGELSSYDIIYVDWNNGVDFIQKNAYVLEEVIKYVNQQKASHTTEQNVVLGQSMGGLVARYALKDMENRALNHDTRLYISHDSPHLGANTPLSVQYAARHLRNIYISTPNALAAGDVILPLINNFSDGFSSIINLFGANTSVPTTITPLQAFSLADVPAARQMQFTWLNSNYQIDNSIHNSWQQELASLGYPAGFPTKPIRNIAISNGSECGIPQDSNGNIVSYVKDAGRGTVFGKYLNLVDNLYGSLLNNPAIATASLFPGNSYWQIDFQSKYMTSLNENKSIYNGILKYKKKIFGIISVSVSIADMNVSQPANVLPYDIYGGGYAKGNLGSVNILDGIVSNSFGFIPTASALDIGKGAIALTDADYKNPYIGALPPAAPKNSPFQNFTTNFSSSYPNSKHISFSWDNGNWLRAELNPAIPDQYSNCSFACSNAQITGGNTFCLSGNYSAPAGATYYNWTITEGANLITLTGNGTPNITLSAPPNTSGNVTLSLYMSGSCGYTTITKTISLGLPVINYSVDRVEFCNFVYQAKDYPGVSSNAAYSWQYVSGTGNASAGNFVTSGGYAQFTACPPFSIRLKLTATNSCGSVEEYADLWLNNNDEEINKKAPVKEEQIATERDKVYTVYPNPSKDIVNVDLVNLNNLPENEAVISGKLFDATGRETSGIEFIDNRAVFSVKGLAKGIYVLQIKINNKTENHKIAVK